MRKILILLTMFFGVMPFAANAQQEKPLIAIYELKDLAGTNSEATLSTMLQTAITSTGKFRVMERSQLDVADREARMGRSGRTTSRSGGAKQPYGGADFLVYGTITGLTVTQSSDFVGSMIGGMLSKDGNGPTCTSGKVTLALDIRITNADNGEVRLATSINRTEKLGSSCTGNPSLDGVALMRAASEDIAKQLVTTIYPIVVAGTRGDGAIILNYGNGTIAPNSVMSIFIPGEKVIDPTTGDVLDSGGMSIGLIQITEQTERASFGKPWKCPLRSAAPVGSEARVAAASELAAEKARGKKCK